MSDAADKTTADLRAAREEEIARAERELKAARRMLRMRKAKEDLISFTELMMPSPEDPDNPELSRYLPVKHHKIIAAALQEVERGNMLRLIITLPPRAGKTELCSKKFIPWLLGRNPYKHVIFATYNEDFARDIGKEVRETLRSKPFKQVFPLCDLRPGNSASDRVQTKEGGIASFVGRGGSITGRGGDCLLGDTIIKTNLGDIPICRVGELPGVESVLSYDTETKTQVWRKITAVASRQADLYFRITTQSGRVIEATGEHPFFVLGSWKKARDIHVGDALLALHGIDLVEKFEPVIKPATVWNIQVEGTENFFANDVLVHNCLIADDLIKDSEEANSPTFRAKLWEWFTRVFLTRKMNSSSAVILVMTRWHEDDPIGRLTDPQNECYDAEEAARWKILSLPAIAKDDDPMGRPKGEPLWPERFPLSFLQAARQLDPKGFAALYQGDPAPEDGDFFKKDWLKTYKPDELPKNLRIYAASDHAVSTGQRNDLTCLLPVGVDESGVIWVLPDVWWRRKETDDVVDAMLDIMERHKPLTWWAESGHISKSIGPFLRKRMLERRVFCAIEESTPAKDKQTRAQAIQARMSMGMVRFPGFAPWWSEAEQELLKFPSARHDDFVDALAWIGLGLAKAVSANRTLPPKILGVRPGSIEWIKEASKAEAKARRLAYADGY